MNLPENQVSNPNSSFDSVSEESSQSNLQKKRFQPIPPPSHPRQYRAIGLVRGKYEIAEDQLTQGNLITTDGKKIDSVLLGRVISLVKKHLDLDKEHLWVVYPRTKVNDDSLHLQIVGVWEPATLNQDEHEKPNIISEDEVIENYFSIRGEVVFFDVAKEIVVVKIKQFPRKEGDKPKSFKLQLKGVLEGKPLRHFWDLNVNLEGESLVIPKGSGTDLGIAQKKPRFKKKFDNSSGGNRSNVRKAKPIKSGSGSASGLAKSTSRPKPKLNRAKNSDS